MVSIPEAKREIFKTHTIKNCIVKLDFEDVFDIEDFAKEIISITSSEFPHRRKESQVTVGFNVKANSEDIIQKAEDIKSVPVYTFFNENKDTIKLCNEFFLIQYQNYQNFEKLFDVFSNIFKKFEEKFPNNKYKRLGLRKINMFFSEENDGLSTFEKSLNPFFVNHLKSGFLDKNLFEDYHKLAFNDSNNTECILQFRTEKGIIEDKLQRRFILDIDYFTKEINSENITENLKLLNDKIFNLFMFSITETQKELMRKGTL